jgi:hypothetical protein
MRFLFFVLPCKSTIYQMKSCALIDFGAVQHLREF